MPNGKNCSSSRNLLSSFHALITTPVKCRCLAVQQRKKPSVKNKRQAEAVGTMVRGASSSGSAGFLSTWVFSIVALVLALDYNDHVVAAGQSSVSGDPTLQSHESTLHPPLPLPTTTKAPKCDRMFVSNTNGPRNGTFVSPEFEIPAGHSHQCIYYFIAAPNERVQITFTSFNLRGTPPECNHEYLDLYTEVDSPDIDLITTPFGGRYCGFVPPRKRISMFHMIVIGFYTDRESVEDAFQGMYEFINSTRYQVGTLTPHSSCNFTLSSKVKRKGEFVSPTYPGVYPKNLVCSYTYRGTKDQRIRLEFMDFDLFFGGAHCPFDYVKVYDGSTHNASVIGRYCGQRRNLVVYSSTENLYVEFVTLLRTADSQNRGFSGTYEFSESYVNLGFIGKNDGEHIQGSECDQKILSKKESNGTVYSPNYPFLYHANTICRYFIYGMEDNQNLERVRLEFEKFEIPGIESNCSEGYLKFYLRGQEDIMAFDKHDHSFCGRDVPHIIVSDGPRLFMVFSSGNTQGVGFKARYTFETDYQIPGTAAPDGSCNFTYLSSSQPSGEFNTPWHPSNYPSNTSCVYTVRGRPGEQVRLAFENLKTKTTSMSNYGNSCQNDWVELQNINPDGSATYIGRYCGSQTPGPLMSEFGTFILRVLFHTDAEDISTGFRARYSFHQEESVFGDCGQNISGTEDGVLTSPGYPLKSGAADGQMCNWFIYVKPQHRVLLLFTDFILDGDQSEAGRGCPNAVVRVWTSLNSVPIELCGKTLDKDNQQISSVSNVLRISFMAEKAFDLKGFKAIWTEIKEGPNCSRFRCGINGYCIAPQLECNEVPNCGIDDETDELQCQSGQNGSEVVDETEMFLLIGAGVGVALLILLGFCIWCQRKRKRRRGADRHPHEARHRHTCDVTGTRFSSVDSV